jgi:thiol-disulfide isomerase/thioredoxin
VSDRSWSSTGLEILREPDFSGTHLNRAGVYVVCFGATWCPPTRRFMPKFVAGKGKLGGTLAIADITDLKSPLWETFRIRITPSVLVFRDGEVERRLDGRRFVGLTSSSLAQLESPSPPSGPS